MTIPVMLLIKTSAPVLTIGDFILFVCLFVCFRGAQFYTGQEIFIFATKIGFQIFSEFYPIRGALPFSVLEEILHSFSFFDFLPPPSFL